MVKAESNAPPGVISQLLREARRATRRQAEAEDLFQTVWLAAVEAGREDLSCAANRRWFVGALRRRALFDARTAVRRQIREQRAGLMDVSTGESAEVPIGFVERLPPKLRTTALLVLTGHSKREVLWLLRTNEPALRQRIANIRRRWRAESGGSLDGYPGSAVRSTSASFGTHFWRQPGARALCSPAMIPTGIFLSYAPHESRGPGNQVAAQTT